MGVNLRKISKFTMKIPAFWHTFGLQKYKIPNFHCRLYCMQLARGNTNKSLAVAEMGDRLTTTDTELREGGAAVPLSGGAGSPSNTMWPSGPRPTAMPSFILIHPTFWPQYTNVTDRQADTDRTGQRSNSIGRTVFGRPFVKRFALCYRTLSCPVCVCL